MHLITEGSVSEGEAEAAGETKKEGRRKRKDRWKKRKVRGGGQMEKDERRRRWTDGGKGRMEEEERVSQTQTKPKSFADPGGQGSQPDLHREG